MTLLAFSQNGVDSDLFFISTQRQGTENQRSKFISDINVSLKYSCEIIKLGDYSKKIIFVQVFMKNA